MNDCGKTANFAETVALVEQMDGMIRPDSYLMHLAGALGIPTVAVFSTIPPHLRVSAYPRVAALAPDTACAPRPAIGPIGTIRRGANTIRLSQPGPVLIMYG